MAHTNSGSPHSWFRIFIAVAIFFTLAYFAKAIFIPIAFAFFLYLVLQPLTRKLQKIGIPRAIVAIAMTLTIVILFGGAIYGLSGQAIAWAEKSPQAISTIKKKLRFVQGPAHNLSETTESVASLTEITSGGKKTEVIYEKKSSLGQRLIDAGSSLTSGFFAAMVLLYFLISYGESFLVNISRTFSINDQQDDTELLCRIESSMSKYLMYISGINAVLGIIMGTIFWAFGLPNPVLWGVMVALLNFVPFFGCIVGAGVILLVCLMSFDSFWSIALPPMVYFAINSLEGGVITPTILGKSMSLNPLIILIALMFAGWGWGIAGALLCVPALAAFKLASDQLSEGNRISRLLEL